MLDVVQRINAADKGTSDPLSNEDLETFVRWLRWRRDDWEDGFARSLGYELTVKSLIEHAIVIGERLLNDGK